MTSMTMLDFAFFCICPGERPPLTTLLADGFLLVLGVSDFGDRGCDLLLPLRGVLAKRELFSATCSLDATVNVRLRVFGRRKVACCMLSGSSVFFRYMRRLWSGLLGAASFTN